MDAAVAALVPAGSPGAIVRIDLAGEPVMEAAVGEVAFGCGRLLTVEHPFRIAGTTKPIMAATVLRLEERDLLCIEDSVAEYLPSELVDRLHVVGSISRGRDITVRHLLAHTSGLIDRLLDTGFIEEVSSCPRRVWSPHELVEYGLANAAPLFAPGSGFSHSEDGYVLLGMIVEAATGRSLHEAYRRYVLDPLEMGGTYLEGHEAHRGLDLSHPYLSGSDAICLHPSIDWGGGGLVSTVADLTRFGSALVKGTLFESSGTGEAMQNDPGTGYGLGLYVSSTPGGLTILGHDGRWGSVVLVIPELDLVLAATMNQYVGDASREAFFTGLVDLVHRA